MAGIHKIRRILLVIGLLGIALGARAETAAPADVTDELPRLEAEPVTEKALAEASRRETPAAPRVSEPSRPSASQPSPPVAETSAVTRPAAPRLPPGRPFPVLSRVESTAGAAGSVVGERLLRSILRGVEADELSQGGSLAATALVGILGGVALSLIASFVLGTSRKRARARATAGTHAHARHHRPHHAGAQGRSARPAAHGHGRAHARSHGHGHGHGHSHSAAHGHGAHAHGRGHSHATTAARHARPHPKRSAHATGR